MGVLSADTELKQREGKLEEHVLYTDAEGLSMVQDMAQENVLVDPEVEKCNPQSADGTQPAADATEQGEALDKARAEVRLVAEEGLQRMSAAHKAELEKQAAEASTAVASARKQEEDARQQVSELLNVSL